MIGQFTDNTSCTVDEQIYQSGSQVLMPYRIDTCYLSYNLLFPKNNSRKVVKSEVMWMTWGDVKFEYHTMQLSEL